MSRKHAVLLSVWIGSQLLYWPNPATASEPPMVQLTSDPGVDAHPAWSPDGHSDRFQF
jgi:hypothetical protein